MIRVMVGELAGTLTTAGEADRVNDVLCAHPTPGRMAAVTLGGGMTVAQHLAHMSGVTREWLSQLDEGAASPLPILYDDTREVRVAALETAINAGGTGRLSHPSPAQFVTHMLIQGAHHRGQILLALKVNGFPLSCGAVPVPDEDAMWGPLRGE